MAKIDLNLYSDLGGLTAHVAGLALDNGEDAPLRELLISAAEKLDAAHLYVGNSGLRPARKAA